MEYENGTTHHQGPLHERTASAGAALSAEQQQTLLLGHHLVDFWTNICVCHNLITEEGDGTELPAYQVRFHEANKEVDGTDHINNHEIRNQSEAVTSCSKAARPKH